MHGGLDDATTAVRLYAADTVAVLACPEMDSVKLQTLALELLNTGTDLCVSPALLDATGLRKLPGITIRVDHPLLGGIRRVIKDLFDRSLAGAALLRLSPLLAALAIMIRLSDGGPALFTQVRVGKNGRKFRMYKFRTMVVDAEHSKRQGGRARRQEPRPFQPTEGPPCHSGKSVLAALVGRRMAELFNVVLGHMSIVGPRPALPDEAAKYAVQLHRRLAVKPGLTGLWQVAWRPELSWEELVRLDARYIDNWSFALDLQILWRTGTTLLRGSGL